MEYEILNACTIEWALEACALMCDEMQEDILAQEQSNYVQITKEMASDACDPSLEGQWWKW